MRSGFRGGFAKSHCPGAYVALAIASGVSTFALSATAAPPASTSVGSDVPPVTSAAPATAAPATAAPATAAPATAAPTTAAPATAAPTTTAVPTGAAAPGASNASTKGASAAEDGHQHDGHDHQHDHAADGSGGEPRVGKYYTYPGAPTKAAISCHPDGRPCEHRIEFSADPVADGALFAGAFGFAALSEAIISTGEIRPQQIDARFDTSQLLPLDRSALKQNIDTTADSYSNGAMYLTLAFALTDSVLSGYREDRNAAIVDAVIYGESIAFSWGLTNLAKIGFRRPRPIAYIERDRAIARGQDPATYINPSTDSALSFFSGHTSMSSTVWATATYLAFARSPHTVRPWLTLTGGIVMTSFIAVERVRGGAHFPTDVIAGGLAGMGVGVLVAHLHRYDTQARRPMWIGALPVEGGGVVSFGGRF